MFILGTDYSLRRKTAKNYDKKTAKYKNVHFFDAYFLREFYCN